MSFKFHFTEMAQIYMYVYDYAHVHVSTFVHCTCTCMLQEQRKNKQNHLSTLSDLLYEHKNTLDKINVEQRCGEPLLWLEFWLYRLMHGVMVLYNVHVCHCVASSGATIVHWTYTVLDGTLMLGVHVHVHIQLQSEANYATAETTDSNNYDMKSILRAIFNVSKALSCTELTAILNTITINNPKEICC